MMTSGARLDFSSSTFKCELFFSFLVYKLKHFLQISNVFNKELDGLKQEVPDLLFYICYCCFEIVSIHVQQRNLTRINIKLQRI